MPGGHPSLAHPRPRAARVFLLITLAVAAVGVGWVYRDSIQSSAREAGTGLRDLAWVDRLLGRDPAPSAIAPAAEPEPDTVPPERIEAWLRVLRVTGVAGTGTSARAVLNGQTYRVGEVVAPELGLVFQGLQAERLVFMDESGRSWTRER